MPVTPNQLKRPILVDCPVDFGDGNVVVFTLDRNKINDAWVSNWERLEGEGSVASINDALADLLVGWDIVNEDGTPFPLTASNISDLFNLHDKGRIVKQLMEASVPSDAEGKALSAPSSTQPLDYAAPQSMPQNGLTASPSPEPSASLSPS